VVGIVCGASLLPHFKLIFYLEVCSHVAEIENQKMKTVLRGETSLKYPVERSRWRCKGFIKFKS
jgi:hypothetical protein